MPFIPVAEYSPDQPDYQNPGSANILNVLPRTKQSYGPWAGLSVFSSALTAICQGAYACVDTAGNVNIFAGDATKLYQLLAGSTSFTDVSKAGGYTISSDQRWQGVLFGNTVIMTDFADAPQAFSLGTSSAFADLITTGTTSLKARYVAVTRDWVMFGNTTDATNGAKPQRVWWTAIDDPTNVPIPGTSTAAAVQSDFQDLIGDGGWVQGIVGNLGTSDGAVFQERAVWRVQYNGPPPVFAFSPAEGVRGTPAPGSIVQIGALVYYLGEDGFYVFNGSQSLPIGANRVDKTFFGDLDQSFFYRISGAVDPINKIVYWAYPGSGHDANGNPNRIIAYNWDIDRWSITNAGDITCEVLLRSLTPGYSEETIATIVPNIDTGSQLSFDSRVYTKGRSILAAFDTSHQLNTFTGNNLAPTVDTSETQPVPGYRARLKRVKPITDGGTPSITPITRNRIQDGTAVGTAVAMNANGDCPLNAEGRFHRLRLTMPSNTSFTHISGVFIPDDEITSNGRQ